MKERIWKKIVLNISSLILEEGKQSVPKFQELTKLRTKTKIMFCNNKRIHLCLLNPHSDKPSKMIPTN
jgi:hypothetical protein